jgi:hypothetical protein
MMIVTVMELTEGKHVMLRVKGIETLQRVEQVVNDCASVFGDIVNIYEYPGEDEVRVLMTSGYASGTGFARMVVQLAELEGVF